MATLEAAYGRLRDQLRDLTRVAGDVIAGPALWVLFAVLAVYSAVNPDTRQLFVVGVVVGSIYALGSMGLTLTYGILKFGNFAHGDMMMLGGYFAFFALTGQILGERRDIEASWGLDSLPAATDGLAGLSFGYGLIIATVVAVAAMSALSLGIDRAVYRTLRRRKSSIVIFSIASLGVAIAARSAILIFWGPDPRVFVSGIHPAKSLPLDITLKVDQMFILGVAVALTVVVSLVLYRTKLGKAMRAMSDNPDLARISGINTVQIIRWTWLIGSALVAVAGVLLALQSQLNPQLGFVILLPLFASAILGGVGSPIGALVGSMIVAIAQEVSIEYFDPGYKPGVAFVILILILLLRPRGLFGAKA